MLLEPIKVFSPEEVRDRFIIPVDDWVCDPEDHIIKHAKGYIYIPVASVLNVPENLNYFSVATKKCYNAESMRIHLDRYLNYFLKFYDKEKELLGIYANIKYMMDYYPQYNAEAFLRDINTYILSNSILFKVEMMNLDNYNLSVSKKNGDPSLQYTDKHANIFMKCSMLMKIVIPLVTQFIYIKGIEDVNEFILDIFSDIIHIYDMDVYSKIFETSHRSTAKIAEWNPLWQKQDIRSKNVTTHSMDCVDIIITNIIPKYVYNKNIICLNYDTIERSSHFQVTGIGYDFDFIPLSGSKRDDENNSEYDKFEAHLARVDESLNIQNSVNSKCTMNKIESLYGPFNKDEIGFYNHRMGGVEDFQRYLVLNLFYSEFSDPISAMAHNQEAFSKLVMSAKRLLLSHNMVLMAEIISSKVIRISNRKNLNKKEMDKLQESSYYARVCSKYRNPKVQKKIISLIATIISSEFEFINYYDEDLDGNRIDIISDICGHEALMYIDLI